MRRSGSLLAAVAASVSLITSASAQQPAATAAQANLPPLIMIKLPKPKYPASAHGVSGWVRVECWVSPRGKITSVRVVESEPAGVFDDAAITAMKKARFQRFESREPRLMTQRLIFSSP